MTRAIINWLMAGMTILAMTAVIVSVIRSNCTARSFDLACARDGGGAIYLSDRNVHICLNKSLFSKLEEKP